MSYFWGCYFIVFVFQLLNSLSLYLWKFDTQGDKNIIKFEGDHNSPRPQFYFDSISIFFNNVLQPPEDGEASTYFDLSNNYIISKVNHFISTYFRFYRNLSDTYQTCKLFFYL